MRRLSRESLIILLSVLCLAISLSGCTVYLKGTDINFIDRTEGWQTDIPFISELYYLEYENTGAHIPHRYEYFQNELLKPEKELFYSTKETSYVHRDYIETILKKYYDTRYIDAGTGQPRSRLTKQGTVICFTNEDVLILVDKETGRLLACVDTRVQSEFYFDEKEPILYHVTNIADCTPDELRQLMYAQYDYGLKQQEYFYVLGNVPLPLSAEGAFELAKQASDNGHGPGRSYTYGDYRVYYSEKADAYIIVTIDFVEVISRPNGELLFFSQYSFLNGEDASVQITESP